MMNQKIKPMTESGVLSAITVVMALVGVYVPILGTVAALIWPLPMVILIVRHGLRWGVMAVAVAAVLMAILLEPLLSLRMVVAFAPVGIALGLGYRKGFSAGKLLCVTIAVSIVAKVAVILLVMFVTNINPFAMQLDTMKEAFSGSLDMYRGLNMSEAQLAEAETNFSATLEILSMLFPLIVILMGLFDAYVNFWVAGKVLRKLGQSGLPELAPFSEWHLSSFFLYLYGFGLVGMYWGGTRQIQWLYQLSFNANLLASFFGLIQGLALLQYMGNHWNLSKFMRCIIVLFVLLNGTFAQILAFTGLFDMVFDYRRRFSSKNNGN